MKPNLTWQSGRNWCSGQQWPYDEILACVNEFLDHDGSPREYDFLPGLRLPELDDRISAQDTKRVAVFDKHLKRYIENQNTIREESSRIAPYLSRLPTTRALSDLSLDRTDSASMDIWVGVAQLFAVVTAVRGWGGSGGRAALLLHLKRPNLIPLLLRPVREYLMRTARYSDPKTHRLVEAIVERVQGNVIRPLVDDLLHLTVAYWGDLQPNTAVFDQLRRDLPDPYRELSAVRLLDILIWGYASGHKPVWRESRYHREFCPVDALGNDTASPVEASSVGSATKTNLPAKEVLSIQEVATYLDVPTPLVEQLLERRKLHGIRIGPLWRIRRTDLDAFLDRGGEGGEASSPPSSSSA